MHGFERTSVGYVARLDPFERDVLVQVVADVAELLGDRPVAFADGEDDGEDDGEGAGVGEGEGERDGRTSPEDGPRPDGADAWTSLDPHRDQLLPPDDRGVRRLLPDASKDAVLAAEFRRLTEDELRRTKCDRLHRLWDTLIRLPFEPRSTELELLVPPEQADDLAATLTDIRLVLADRLDLETDEDVDALYDELADADTLAELDEELDEELAASAEAGLGAPAAAGPVTGASAEPGLGAPPGGAGSAAGANGDAMDDSGETERAIELEMRTVRASIGTVYIALTWMQESLLEVMTADLDH